MKYASTQASRTEPEGKGRARGVDEKSPRSHLWRKGWAILLSAADKPAYQVAANRCVHAHRTSVRAWIERHEKEIILPDQVGFR